MKHYVVFQLTGGVCRFSEALQVTERNLELITVPDDAVACYFFDSSEKIVNGKPLSGKEINRSPWYELCPASKVLKHYVVFVFPSSGNLEEMFTLKHSRTEEIAVRNHELIDIPAGTYKYYFFDSWEEIVDGTPLSGRLLNMSQTFYLGEEYTLEEIKTHFPKDKEDISLMEHHGFNRAIKDCNGNWHYLDNRDIVI